MLDSFHGRSPRRCERPRTPPTGRRVRGSASCLPTLATPSRAPPSGPPATTSRRREAAPTRCDNQDWTDYPHVTHLRAGSGWTGYCSSWKDDNQVELIAVLADPPGTLEVGEQKDVEQFGAGAGCTLTLPGSSPGWLQRLTSLTPVRGQAPRPPVVGAPGLPGRA
jgi:hypothetical protein